MKKSYLLAGLAAMMLAACSDNENDLGVTPSGSGSENVSGMLTLLGDQSDRIETATPAKSLSQWRRIQFVGRVKAPTYAETNNWSATAVAIDNDNLYITWHSNRQTKENQAKVWGGAIDKVIGISAVEDGGTFSSVDLVTAVSDTLKFNNVLVNGGNLYLSSTSAVVNGAVAKVAVDALTGGEGTHVDVTVIPFPGASVNAVIPYGDGKLLAVSGYDPGLTGTIDIATDKADVAVTDTVPDYGGKYLASDGTSYWTLRNTDAINTDSAAYIVKYEGPASLEEKTITLDCYLKASVKAEETYSMSGGWQEEDMGDKTPFYGKHVMAVHKSGENVYAYVGAGKNGLRVYNLTTGDGAVVWNNNTFTTGVCVYEADDQTFLLAASGQGLRIYTIKEDGKLDLWGYEVENYKDGQPVKNNTNFKISDERHSANFVAAHKNGKDVYAYVAYGQSGVRVYKFNPTIKDEHSQNNGDLTIK